MWKIEIWLSKAVKLIGQIRINEALRMMLYDGVRVLAWRTAVYQKLHFCRLGVTNAQASWLAQVGRGVLIG